MSEVFDPQPTLMGELIMVRPLAAADQEELYQAASDPLVWDQHPFPRYERDRFDEYFREGLESGSAFAVVDRSTGRIIGSSRYYEQEGDGIRIGYTFLARSHWGGAVNAELKKLMLDHAFRHFIKVYFDIGRDNLRSRKAVEKIGARFVGEKEQKGKPYTIYCIERTAELDR